LRVLVTGGAGYMGSTLVRILLASGQQVRVLDSLTAGGGSLLGVWSDPGFEFRRGDIRDPAAVRESVQGVDAVVHLAAIVGDPACARQPELARSTNLDAPLLLLEESRRAGTKRFIFASTCSNYGRMASPEDFVDENSELRPISLYAETKVEIEKTLLDPAQTGDLCATALRFSTLFGVGGRMRFDLTVNEFVMEALTKKKLVVYGEQFWRPYVHVRDAARAIELVLQSDEGKVRNEVFNVGSTDQNFRKGQLVDMVCSIAPETVVEKVQKNEDPRDYRVSFTKIQEQLGFRVTRTVQQGMEEIAQLIRDGIITDFDDPHYRN
jgi:nucleoside-diphosphate-sugar epimerase